MEEFEFIDELNAPTKIYKGLHLFDVAFIGAFFGIMLMFRDQVHPYVIWPYYIFNLFVGLILTIHSPFNPQKRIFQSIWYALKRDRRAYKPISTFIVERDTVNTMIEDE